MSSDTNLFLQCCRRGPASPCSHWLEGSWNYPHTWMVLVVWVAVWAVWALELRQALAELEWVLAALAASGWAT